ncbi:MAG: acyl-ACP--UDP-N-acetylglucosamine O-acyltransferase [Oleiphilaceae bacterium]|nr:acyl-ACP--UDP-N-acetylglucosamine O-acyltransferase [Oleiphilaceae bacterium]
MNNKQQAEIHASAIIDPAARLADDVSVGPYAIIGAGVEIESGTSIGPHAVINGPTRIGRDNRIHAHVSLGDAPQDLGYRGEETRLEIGDRNTIREFVSIHRGTPKDRALTTVGNDNLFMVQSHVGHDCIIGDNVIMANCVNVGGHVVVEDRANIAGTVAIHQFTRIGRLAMIGGGSIVLRDIPPFMLANGNSAKLFGLNRRGLQRAGFDADGIADLKRAYKILYRSGLPLAEAIRQLSEAPQSAAVKELLNFMQPSKRGFSR